MDHREPQMLLSGNSGIIRGQDGIPLVNQVIRQVGVILKRTAQVLQAFYIRFVIFVQRGSLRRTRSQRAA